MIRPGVLLLLASSVLVLGAAGSARPATSAVSVSTSVVISQVYGGAGCGTAGCSTYKNDFIEIFNRGSSPVNLNGYSVQYAAATGMAWQVTGLTVTTLQPGEYYLVAEAFGANGVNTLPTPDVTGTIAMSSTAGKIALVDNTSALSGTCPVSAAILDFLGYGATANCAEGANAPAPSTTTADVRGGNGCTESDNNASDFTAGTPTPRNTSSPANVCATTGVEVQALRADRSGRSVILRWRTGSDTRLLGFNVYGERQKLNRRLIDVGYGGRYTSRVDGRFARYWLEVVRLDGTRSRVGPARPSGR